ncbi:hypothetical protein [Neisseria lactamica]|uniref:hypothetical protein n=1 Tax=Neisseria lactamica TaxID=486 RepID=UPI00186538CA|nr:hypothetical protein [Neisseria lactamica]
MNPYQFCQNQIDEWTEISRRASENADIALFERAEEEIANYCEMQKRYETDGNGINEGG